MQYFPYRPVGDPIGTEDAARRDPFTGGRAFEGPMSGAGGGRAPVLLTYRCTALSAMLAEGEADDYRDD